LIHPRGRGNPLFPRPGFELHPPESRGLALRRGGVEHAGFRRLSGSASEAPGGMVSERNRGRRHRRRPLRRIRVRCPGAVRADRVHRRAACRARPPRQLSSICSEFRRTYSATKSRTALAAEGSFPRRWPLWGAMGCALAPAVCGDTSPVRHRRGIPAGVGQPRLPLLLHPGRRDRLRRLLSPVPGPAAADERPRRPPCIPRQSVPGLCRCTRRADVERIQLGPCLSL